MWPLTNFKIDVSDHERKGMLVELKHIYWKLLATLREKRLRRQKSMLHLKMMSASIRRVK